MKVSQSGITSLTMSNPSLCTAILLKYYSVNDLSTSKYNFYPHKFSVTSLFKEQIEDKTTSLLVQIDNRIRILVMLQIMMLNISSPVYVITKISAIISTYLTAKFEQ